MKEFQNFESEEKRFLKNLFKRIFSKVLKVSLLLLLFLGIGLIIYLVYFRTNKIEILVETPPEVLAGEKVFLKAKVINKSYFSLKNASLSLILPEKATSAEFEEEKTIKKTLGEIKKGEEKETEFSFRLFGSPHKIQILKLVLNWEKPGFKINFKKEKKVEIEISEPIVSLDFFTPKEVLPETEFSFSLKYQNNSEKYLEDLAIKLLLPENLKIIESSPEIKGNLFLVKEISPFEIGKINLKAKYSAIISEKREIPLKAEIAFLKKNKSILIEEKEGKINLVPPPLALTIEPSFDKNKPLSLGETLHFKIFYQNNTQITLKDLVLKTKLNSHLFDFETLVSEGEFNLKNKEITWTASLKDSLKALSPHQKDFVEFEIALKKEFLPRSEKDFNQIIEIESEITTPTVPYYLQAKKLISKAKISFKLQTKTELSCKILFYDAPSKILNQGPFPPKVNQTTNFTVHWEITNYFNDLEDVEVKTFLPQNVTYSGVFKTNTNIAPIYNERTKEFVWRLEKIEKGAGILKEKPYLIFQIALTPSPPQIGKFATLSNETTLSATDSFTSTDIYSACSKITTGDLWKYDPQIAAGEGEVER